MAAARKLVIRRGGTPLAGVIQKSMSVNAEPIDITDDQSDGWRVLDDDVGRRSIDLSFDGIVLDNALRAQILAGTPSLKLTDITVVFPNGDSISGDFFLNSIEESGSENAANGFTGSLQSSGPITFTAAP